MNIRGNTMSGFVFSEDPRECALQFVECIAITRNELAGRMAYHRHIVQRQREQLAGAPMTVDQLNEQFLSREQCLRVAWKIHNIRGCLSSLCRKHTEFISLPGVAEALGVSDSN